MLKAGERYDSFGFEQVAVLLNCLRSARLTEPVLLDKL
jgi:hypothetical protein